MNETLSAAGHKKAPAGCSRGERSKLAPFSQTSLHLAQRYPICPCSAADSRRRLNWDRINAGGLDRLARCLDVYRFELLEHRWRLQVIAGPEAEAKP